MNWDNFFRWVFFSAGLILAIFAGYMFYIDNIPAGAAWLAMGVGFLCFGTRVRRDSHDPASSDEDSNVNAELRDMAVLIAEIAVSSLKNVGRTIPPNTKEIEDMEGRLNRFLDSMPLTQSEREEIAGEFDKLRNRTRRNEGGRALMRNARL